MIVRPLLAAGALLLCAHWGLEGCHRGRKSDATQGATPDSLIGVVSVTGTSFEKRLTLRTGDGARTGSAKLTLTLSATPADSSAISRLGGAEIVVRGSRDGTRFRVANFAVLRIDGAPVTDGVVLRDGRRLALQAARGRVDLGNPPPALRAMIGARVWVGGPLDTGPNTYGVIVPSP